ncbi:hypothetical protein HYU90_01305 [Candidatus Collierbacteria bacterium]|nr:hypothetical protein [Candidatus Collierbacteria bacterium]
MKRILLNHGHIRTTIDSRAACYLMMLSFFFEDIPLSNEQEKLFFEEFSGRGNEIDISKLKIDAKKRDLDVIVRYGAKVRTELFNDFIIEGRLILFGGSSEGVDLNWLVSGLNRNGDFFITDPRIRRKDLYPKSLVELLMYSPKDRWCLAIKNKE